MNISTKWHDSSQKLIVLTFEHGWTWDDWYVALQDLIDMRASVPYPVGLIIDARRGAELPSIRVTEQLRASWESLPNDGSPLVVLGVSGVLRDLSSMMARITGQSHRLFFVDTFEAALAKTHTWEQDQSLSDA